MPTSNCGGGGGRVGISEELRIHPRDLRRIPADTVLFQQADSTPSEGAARFDLLMVGRLDPGLPGAARWTPVVDGTDAGDLAPLLAVAGATIPEAGPVIDPAVVVLRSRQGPTPRLRSVRPREVRWRHKEGFVSGDLLSTRARLDDLGWRLTEGTSELVLALYRKGMPPLPPTPPIELTIDGSAPLDLLPGQAGGWVFGLPVGTRNIDSVELRCDACTLDEGAPIVGVRELLAR